MKRHYQSGKIKIASVIIVAVIIYAGFCVFKLVSANITPGQVKNEITNAIGIERGPTFTVAKGEKIVRDVLKRHGLLESEYNEEDAEEVEIDNTNYGPDAEGQREHQQINVEIDTKTAMVHFYTNFYIEVDYIFFKQVKYFEVEGEVQNFN